MPPHATGGPQHGPMDNGPMNEASGTDAGGGNRHLLSFRPLASKIELRGRYTRFVGLMRWLLAFGAVGLAAAMVIWPYFSPRTSGRPVEFTKGIQISNDGRPTMTNARYLATDAKGQPYTITAKRAYQQTGNTNVVFMEHIEGDITLNSGSWLSISADRGKFDQAKQLLTLESNVALYSDAGYEMHTQQARINLAAGTAQGDMHVQGQGPTGLLDASGFRIADNGNSIDFTGPVHMTVYPGSKP